MKAKQNIKMTNNKLNKLALEQLEFLNGYEIHSLQYEGCVGVEGNKLYIPHYDKIITLTTSQQVHDLWEEYLFQKDY
tara:strand:- start:22 stop:252 length:231 start_codon:yes stop_codon:yes gene_type:complete